MLRDRFLHCPRCACGLDEAGSRISCGKCHGTLIPENELIDEVSGQQARALLSPKSRWNKREPIKFIHDVGPAIQTARAALECPRCSTAMTRHRLFTVEIDRCPAHGLWLDGVSGVETILRGALEGL